jgi:pyruvate-formate lyase-activating enzyme
MPESIHDYAAKLRHPAVRRDVIASVRRRGERRPASFADAFRSVHAQAAGPISINLDLTVACNYHCTHCIDAAVLNRGHLFSPDDVRRSLAVLRVAGLRSVILIGGGEPTLHPHFGTAVKAIKALGLQCAIVSNGSGNAKIAEVAAWLTPKDWVRLSLDAATDETFQAMHLPRGKGVSLDGICRSAIAIKDANPAVSLGFSFIVTWPGATANGQPIVDNIDDMSAAAGLAREHGFDFIAFKPLLDRDDGGAETMPFREDGTRDAERAELAERVAGQVAAARALETDGFRVHTSRNLVALGRADALDQSRRQPGQCRMRLFRQVVTPTGVFGCPVYRGNAVDRIGAANSYASVEDFLRARRQTAELTERFDASVECRAISCIYNSTNWWLQDVHAGDGDMGPSAARDFFL